jgi:hypothetical protein
LQVTGSWNNPDFLHFMPTGTEYRKVSPGCVLEARIGCVALRPLHKQSKGGLQRLLCNSTSCLRQSMRARRSQAVKVKVPHDSPSLVYDIKYFGEWLMGQ